MVKIINGLFQAVAGSFIPEVSSFKKCLVGFRVHGLQVLQLGLLVWIQFDPAEGPGYRATRKRWSAVGAST
jgi:hypothetical protein